MDKQENLTPEKSLDDARDIKAEMDKGLDEPDESNEKGED
jgi:hypothetical protein